MTTKPDVSLDGVVTSAIAAPGAIMILSGTICAPPICASHCNPGRSSGPIRREGKRKRKSATGPPSFASYAARRGPRPTRLASWSRSSKRKHHMSDFDAALDEAARVVLKTAELVDEYE